MVQKLLVDTCVWLDLARDYRQEPIIRALEDLILAHDIELILGPYIDYLTVHAASFRSVSRVTGVTNVNAPRRADAPSPDAMMLRAAFRSALSDGHRPCT